MKMVWHEFLAKLQEPVYNTQLRNTERNSPKKEPETGFQRQMTGSRPLYDISRFKRWP